MYTKLYQHKGRRSTPKNGRKDITPDEHELGTDANSTEVGCKQGCGRRTCGTATATSIRSEAVFSELITYDYPVCFVAAVEVDASNSVCETYFSTSQLV